MIAKTGRFTEFERTWYALLCDSFRSLPKYEQEHTCLMSLNFSSASTEGFLSG
jgi:hypothetical protein